MAKFKHTPGPWEQSEYGIRTSLDITGNYICRAPHPGFAPQSFGKWETNAQLISCAPEMLEALIHSWKHFIKSIEEVDGCPYDNCIKHSDNTTSCREEDCIHYSLENKLKSIIEKATGLSIEEVMKDE